MSSLSARGVRRITKVVRMSSGSQVINQLINCKICKQPLVPTHDGQILKYFLVRRPTPQ
jgi:hypothetical protein